MGRVDERAVDFNSEVAVWAGGISRGAGVCDQQVGFEFAVNHFMHEKNGLFKPLFLNFDEF